MCNENYTNNGNRHEAAEVHTPAASASDIINREKSMNKVWSFVGGAVLGAAGVVAVALVADKLTYGEGSLKESVEQPKLLALPEGNREVSGNTP